MTNLRCSKCGKFLGHYICGTDPATGKFSLTTPWHRCGHIKDVKGKFIKYTWMTVQTALWLQDPTRNILIDLP